MWGTQDGGREGIIANGQKVSFSADENVLEVDSGDGYITLTT